VIFLAPDKLAQQIGVGDYADKLSMESLSA
jgi:hypothetical protein